jgi:site-specific DNA-methyltransferase (adenine-specific)
LDCPTTLDSLVESIDQTPISVTPKGILYKGDSLEVLKKFPDHSVSLIITDPPYHTTGKKNIYGDTAFKEDEHYLEWMALYSKEWIRVLKPNGSLFCFCSPAMAGRLEGILFNYFNVLSHIVWTKPNEPGFDGWKQKMSKGALRQWYDHSERIIFAEPAKPGNLYRSYFGNLIKEFRLEAGLTCKSLTEMIGAYGKVNHGGAVANWEAGRNVPSEEQYEKLRWAIKQTSGKEMPEYQEVVRPFNVDKTKEFIDVWTFPNIRPYNGKHPAEKPIALLEHAIAATTYPGDIVLDCFAGSGSTAVAAMKLGRRSVSIEIEQKWCNKIAKLLKFLSDRDYTIFPDNYDSTSMSLERFQGRLF